MMQLSLILKIKKVVISTDLLIEGVPFRFSIHAIKTFRVQSSGVNVSDICAMNAKATQITFL
jgi:thiamine-monophosphate kinase